ncbi:MAG: dihydroorotase [Bacillota bacterium]
MAERLIIKGGRVVDPKNKVDKVLDILIEDGKIKMLSEDIDAQGAKVINAIGKVVAPGFVDIHVHLREPGFEHKETIKTGTMSAAVGGFTSVACMPNTKPALHSKAVIEFVKDKAAKEGVVNVFPIGSITMDIEGKELAPMEELVEAGVVAVSDDGKTPMDKEIMENAFKKAKALSILLIDHCEDHDLASGGSIHEGEASVRTGIKGIPSAAEWKIVQRDIVLAEKYDTPVHIAHISTKEAVELVRSAKARGIKITCEVAPHHFALTDEIIERGNTYTKVNPPIRSREDVDAVIAGLMDGTIDIIATDHAPHDEGSKQVDYERAAFGISGFETAFCIGYTELVEKGRLSLSQLIEKMSWKAAEIIGIDKGELGVGADADIVILDIAKEEIIDREAFVSKGKNTPFHGWRAKGKPVCTLVQGKVVMEGGKIACS